jgi:hypothetical protein
MESMKLVGHIEEQVCLVRLILTYPNKYSQLAISDKAANWQCRRTGENWKFQ